MASEWPNYAFFHQQVAIGKKNLSSMRKSAVKLQDQHLKEHFFPMFKDFSDLGF